MDVTSEEQSVRFVTKPPVNVSVVNVFKEDLAMNHFNCIISQLSTNTNTKLKTDTHPHVHPSGLPMTKVCSLAILGVVTLCSLKFK